MLYFVWLVLRNKCLYCQTEQYAFRNNANASFRVKIPSHIIERISRWKWCNYVISCMGVYAMNWPKCSGEKWWSYKLCYCLPSWMDKQSVVGWFSICNWTRGLWRSQVAHTSNKSHINILCGFDQTKNYLCGVAGYRLQHIILYYIITGKGSGKPHATRPRGQASHIYNPKLNSKSFVLLSPPEWDSPLSTCTPFPLNSSIIHVIFPFYTSRVHVDFPFSTSFGKNNSLITLSN